MLLEAGADQNISNTEGYTPLHRAAFNGFLRTARLLLWHDATDIHAKTENGSTALELAAISEQLAMLEMLHAYDFTIDER